MLSLVTETETIEERAYEVVATELGIATGRIERRARFAEDLEADSLDMQCVIMAAESEFSVAITDDEAARLRTVGELISLLRRKVVA